MGEERQNASPAPRRKARYRFEYEQRPTLRIPLVLAVAAALGLAATAYLRGFEPPKRNTATRTASIEAPALALAALKPEPAAPRASPKLSPPKPSPIHAAAPTPPPAPPPVMAEPAPSPPLPPPAAPVQPSPGEARLASLAASAASVPAVDPCASIRGAVDRLTCADPAVRAAAQRVDAAYRNAMKLTDNRGKVLREQERWLARRSSVEADRAAVLAYFEGRYHELWPVPMRVGPRLPRIVKAPES